MARCITAKSSSLFSSSSSQSSREGQEQWYLLAAPSLSLLAVAFSLSLLAYSRNLAVSQLDRGGSFCSLKARLLCCLPSSSSSDSRETFSILRYSSISLRYSQPISFFLVRMSLSRTTWSKVAGLVVGLGGLVVKAGMGVRLGSSRLEVQRSSQRSLREEEERGGAAICYSYRSSAQCIICNFSFEPTPLIQIHYYNVPSSPLFFSMGSFPHCLLKSPNCHIINYIQMLASRNFWLKATAFLLTFLGYASLHSLREGWSYSKQQLQRQFQVSADFLGIIDALYLISYSFGMAALGSIIHRVSLKTYIIAGLILASLSYVLFPLIFAMSGFFSPVLVGVLMCLNGFFQATGWPGMMGIFGNWFSKNKKGVLMGIWAMNANVGNIIASSLCNLLEEHGMSWVWNFAITAAFAVGVAVLMLLLLKEKPEEELTDGSLLEASTLTDGEQSPAKQNAGGQASILDESPQSSLRYGVFSVLCLPRVPLYVLGYSCLKGCIYGLLFWLPVFFGEKGGSIASEKGYIASMIDLGSLIGGTAVGFLVDRYNRRALFLSPLLLFSSVVMFIVSFALTNVVWEYYLAMFLIGNCIGGPYNIIGTVIAIDIGNNIKEKGSVTKVSSLIEGSAAFFTAISMIFIPRIPFQLIFYLFAAECIIATLALLPLFLQELRAATAKDQGHLLEETEAKQ